MVVLCSVQRLLEELKQSNPGDGFCRMETHLLMLHILQATSK